MPGSGRVRPPRPAGGERAAGRPPSSPLPEVAPRQVPPPPPPAGNSGRTMARPAPPRRRTAAPSGRTRPPRHRPVRAGAAGCLPRRAAGRPAARKAGPSGGVAARAGYRLPPSGGRGNRAADAGLQPHHGSLLGLHGGPPARCSRRCRSGSSVASVRHFESEGRGRRRRHRPEGAAAVTRPSRRTASRPQPAPRGGSGCTAQAPPALRACSVPLSR